MHLAVPNSIWPTWKGTFQFSRDSQTANHQPAGISALPQIYASTIVCRGFAADRPCRGERYGSLTMICYSYVLDAVLLPPLTKKDLGRETLFSGPFFLIRCRC